MKRPLSFALSGGLGLMVAGNVLIAATYGLVRLAYGLFLPGIQASLGFGATFAGYVSAAASLAYCLGALVGLEADRQPRLLVVAAVVAGTTGSSGMAMAGNATTFALAAALGSAGVGMISPALVGLIARSVTEERRERTQTVVNSGTGPGVVAAGLLAATLLPHWRLGFVMGAVVTALAGVAVLRLGSADRTPRGAAGQDHSPLRSVLEAWRRPALGALLLGAASSAVWTFGRSQIAAEGASQATATACWVGIGLGGTAAAVTARALNSLRPPQAWMLTTACVAAAVGVLAFAAGHPPAAFAACVAFGWAFVAATSVLIAWGGQLTPAREAASTSAFFVMLVLGQAAGAALAGEVAEGRGLSTAFVGAMVAAVLATACGVERVRESRAWSAAALPRSGRGSATRSPAGSPGRRPSR